MAKVVISSFVKWKIEDLIETLYREEYFGFFENAIAYADAIVDFIYTVPFQKCKATTNPFHGTWYCRYQHNRKTFWFIIFDTDGQTFIIRDVINNYSPDYPKLIAGI